MEKRFKVREICVYGLFIALVYISTRFINIPGPTEGGLFHLGNAISFTIAIVFGKKAGAIAGAFGMSLFDITSAYFIWAPFTFIIRFLMGWSLGFFANKKIKINKLMLGIGYLIASILMILGYYIAEVLLFGNLITPLQSIVGNSMQCIVGIILSLPLALMLKKGFLKRGIKTIN